MSILLQIKIRFLLLLILVCFLIGCVETIITIRVFPDGQYTMNFLSKGDSTDVFNHDFPHPSGTNWFTKIHREIQDDEKVWTMETNGISKGVTIFTSYKDSLTTLRHPIQVKRTEGFFSTRYILHNVFVGRKVYRKYPLFGQSLQENTNDSTRWMDEAFYYMCATALEDLQENPETAINTNIAERLKQHVRNTLQHVSQKKLFEELENKEKFITQMLQPFRETLPGGYAKKLSLATNVYEEELQLTSELQDDQFQYRIFMPGAITSTNADTISGDTLKWSFGLTQYINDDYVIEAASVVYSTKRIQITGLLIAFTLLIALFSFYKRGR